MNWGHSVQLEHAVLTLERLFLHLKYTWNTRFKFAHHAMDVSPIVRLDLAVRRVPRQQGGPGQRHYGAFFLAKWFSWIGSAELFEM